MAIVGFDAELTEAAYTSFLKKQKHARNDCFLKEGETFFEFLNSDEADFRKYPEGEMLLRKLAEE